MCGEVIGAACCWMCCRSVAGMSSACEYVMGKLRCVSENVSYVSHSDHADVNVR